MPKNIKNKYHPAFTIVELLVVIVVIGILAAVIIVSYSSITKKAIDASIKSDLSGASKQLASYQVINGVYPNSVTDCPNPAAGNLCLKPSGNNTYSAYSVNNSTNPPTYSLTVTNTDIAYRISNSSSVPSVAVTGWKMIDLGGDFACGIASNDLAYCWGANAAYTNQLGNNTNVSSLVPTAVYAAGVLSGKTIKSLSTGQSSTCSIASDDKAYCWGGNADNALGSTTPGQSLVPVSVYTSGSLSGKTIKSISSGISYSCAIASDDQLYCWGYNGSGQLGDGSTTSKQYPGIIDNSNVLSGKTIKAVSAGDSSTCVIASDDKAYCWGGNYYGQLGDGTTNDSLSPVAVSTSGLLSGKTIKTISVGRNYACAIASDNKIYCWGNGYFGTLGNNQNNEVNEMPVAVYTGGALSGKTVISISTFEFHMCAITSDSKVYCWGRNTEGQVGDNTTTDRSYPVAVYTSGVLNGKAIARLATGGFTGRFTCAIDSNNQSYCWGLNTYGQLGNNSTTQSLFPVAVTNP